ncbi:BadF/BadG/BcrA/BcrD ATPase family protein [Angustibacter peucedani]
MLADTTGAVLAHVRGAGTRSHVEGIGPMVERVAALVRQAREQAGVPSSEVLSAGAFYIANLDHDESERAALQAVQRLEIVRAPLVGNDTVAVLHAGTVDGWGVAVVSGAGINALGVAPDGREARFLALGDVTGDWGGGWAVAVSGLGAAVRAGDGRGGPTVLRERLAQHFARASVEDLAIAVTAGQVGHDELTAAAPVVFAAAEDGDGPAVAVVHRLADEVALFVRAAVDRLGLRDVDVPVVLAGGTLQHGPRLLLDRITDDLAHTLPRARPRVLDVPPVAGAVLAALAHAGAAPDALARARAGVSPVPA